jgi:hypothetical protein
VLFKISQFNLRKEYRSRALENKILRSTFEPRREEEAGGWMKLHNVELQHLSSSIKVRNVLTN